MNYLNISNLKLWMTSSVVKVTDSRILSDSKYWSGSAPGVPSSGWTWIELEKHPCKLVGGFIGLSTRFVKFLPDEMMIPWDDFYHRLLHHQSVVTMLSHDPSHPIPLSKRPTARGSALLQAISLCMPLKPESLHVDLHEHHEEAYHSPVPWPWPKKSEVFVQEKRCFFKIIIMVEYGCFGYRVKPCSRTKWQFYATWMG